MAFKMSASPPPKKIAATVGVDYSKHLGGETSIMPEKIVAQPVTGITSKEQGKNGPVGETEILHPGVFVTKANGCAVTVEGSRTLNLGNYESARIGVSVTIPCDPELLGEAYAWGSEWVSGKIEEAVKQAKGE